MYYDAKKDEPIGSPIPLNRPPLPELPFSSWSLDSVGMCVVSSLSGILKLCIQMSFKCVVVKELGERLLVLCDVSMEWS